MSKIPAVYLEPKGAAWFLMGLTITFLLIHLFRDRVPSEGRAPGPPSLPIIGNLHQFPTKNFHLEFQKLAQKYGRIVHMALGRTDLFLLNDPVVVRDLLEKRSQNYSCRPDLFARHFGDNLNIALRDNDDIWRRQRRMYHVRLNLNSANIYLPYQHFDSLQLINDLVVDPARWVSHVQRYTASISTGVLYGWRTPRPDTGYVRDLLQWMDVTSEAINFQLVDFYPFLRPLYQALPTWASRSKQKLQNLKELEDRVFFELLDRAKEQIATGKARPSFIRDMLLDTDKDRLNDRQIANNAAHGFGAAMDTSANTILGFFKAMILFPDVQSRAHEELDRVIGGGRLPIWDDRESLPYIRGVVEETLRWAPSPISGAVPHSAKADDVYEGFKIPRGSIIMMNIWTLNHQGLEDSRDFDPARHSDQETLTENNAISQDSSRRRHFTFGAGRRVCPGFHVAERNLFVAISRILWGFRLERARNTDGSPKPVNRDAVTPGLIVRPEDFDCVIKSRDAEREAFMLRAWKDAESELDPEGNFKDEFIQKAFADVKGLFKT